MTERKLLASPFDFCMIHADPFSKEIEVKTTSYVRLAEITHHTLKWAIL
jgi:hypothetical protein